MELVGASGDLVMEHLESLFWPGMVKEDCGTSWEVDHVRPIDSFDLTDPVQQKDCFYYTNLQPLWADDNLKKGSRLDWDPSESIHELPVRLR